MSIVCGTDFSKAADGALHVATRLAKKRDEILVLVHALEPWAPYPTPLGPELVQAETVRREAAERRLSELAAQARGAGVEVQTRLEVGQTHKVLAEAARVDAVDLVVLGGRRHGEATKWRGSGITSRLADEVAAPVLVVREEDPGLADWLDGRRTLTALVAISEELASDAAVAWARAMAGFGSCAVHFVHWYWPPAAYQRFGLAGGDWYGGNGEASALLERNLRARLGDASHASLSARPTWGSVGEAVATTARDLRADLVVIGSHQRHGLGRFVHGSVSHDVLGRVDASIAVVPARALRDERARPRKPGHILVPTELSPTANRAVAQAYALVGEGGAVDLLHVVEAPRIKPSFGDRPQVLSAEGRATLEAQLRGLIPEEAAGRGVTTSVEVVEAPDVGEAIVQAAERHASDFVCMTSHAREGVARALLGSVAEHVMRRVHCPVVVVRVGKER